MEADEDLTYYFFTLQDNTHLLILVQVLIDDVSVLMQYNTGAAFLLINQATYPRNKEILKKTLQSKPVNIEAYTGE